MQWNARSQKASFTYNGEDHLLVVSAWTFPIGSGAARQIARLGEVRRVQRVMGDERTIFVWLNTRDLDGAAMAIDKVL